jgi:hypothetical protein
MRAPRQMTLTQDLGAQVHRVLEDPGPDPDWSYHSDSAYDAVVQTHWPPFRSDRYVVSGLCDSES